MSVAIDDKVVEVFDELEKFVYYLANGAANPDVPLMDADEIAGELFLEIVKGVQHYTDLPHEQLLAVIRKMLDNRIGELVYRYCITHRKSAITAEDINSLDRDESEDVSPFIISTDIQVIADVSMQFNPEALADSRLRMEELRTKLSYNALKVLDAMLYGNELLYTQIVLAEIRAKEVNGYESYTPRMKPWQVAESIALDEKEVRRCIHEIKTTYKQVLSHE